MPAVGMLLGLGGYGVALWGYCLLQGQNVKLTQLFNPVNVYKWNSGGQIPDTLLLPDGIKASTSTVAGTNPAGTNLSNANPQGGAALSGANQPGVQGVVAGGHGR